MSQNRGIVKELFEILLEAKQNIPDWLTKCKNEADFGGRQSGRGSGRGNRFGSRGPRFGATDFRKESGGGKGGWGHSSSNGGGQYGGGGSSSNSWF